MQLIYMMIGLIGIAFVVVGVGYYFWYKRKINQMFVQRKETSKLLSPSTIVQCLLVVGLVVSGGLYYYGVNYVDNSDKFSIYNIYNMTTNNHTVESIYYVPEGSDHEYIDFINGTIKEDNYSKEEITGNNMLATIYTTNKPYKKDRADAVIVIEYFGEEMFKIVGFDYNTTILGTSAALSRGFFTEKATYANKWVYVINSEFEGYNGTINLYISSEEDEENMVNFMFDNYAARQEDTDATIEDTLSEEVAALLVGYIRINYTVSKASE